MPSFPPTILKRVGHCWLVCTLVKTLGSERNLPCAERPVGVMNRVLLAPLSQSLSPRLKRSFSVLTLSPRLSQGRLSHICPGLRSATSVASVKPVASVKSVATAKSVASAKSVNSVLWNGDLRNLLWPVPGWQKCLLSSAF